MSSDESLKREVERELEWDPQVGAAHIAVIVEDGAVTLTGHVSKYGEKYAAVRAAERVYGVRAVADEIQVRLEGSDVKDDAAIAEAITHAFEWNTRVPDNVKAEVRNGIVTLRGEVEWEYQRDAAERAVRYVPGVRGVSNLTVVKPRTRKTSEIEKRIAEAIKRTAELDARSISVTADNGTVRLLGRVHSPYEKRIAEQAAASAAGVSKVENEIQVVP